ncbi:MAG: hypothetical protein M3T55_04225 [Pseudomonadota bacterium]|nr:hypothetical protein [Pseudomonadota bacterium]
MRASKHWKVQNIDDPELTQMVAAFDKHSIPFSGDDCYYPFALNRENRKQIIAEAAKVRREGAAVNAGLRAESLERGEERRAKRKERMALREKRLAERRSAPADQSDPMPPAAGG